MRLALDHPETVTALAVLDAVPIGEALRRADSAGAMCRQPDEPAGQTISR
ncbi:MAG TPA: hypothetical protein VIJ00_10590 [Nakamurella sp.]